MKGKFLSISMILLLFTCHSQENRLEKLNTDMERASYLSNAGFRINYNGLKAGQNIEKITIDQKSQLEYVKYSEICAIKSIKELFFTDIQRINFSEDDIKECNTENIIRLDFTNSSYDITSVCKFFKSLKAPNIEIGFYRTQIKGEDLVCISDIINLDSFAVEQKISFSDEEFCQFTYKAKKLTFLRLNDTKLTKKSLNCMLELPSLNEVMLQRWQNVSESEMDKWVKQYERKYNRKLEAQIIDPSGYER